MSLNGTYHRVRVREHCLNGSYHRVRVRVRP